MIEYFKDHLFMCVSKHFWFGLVTMEEYLLFYSTLKYITPSFEVLLWM